MYDETVNFSSQKELQIKIMFWSKHKSQVMIRHLKSMFLQHAKAEDLVKNILEAVTKCKLNINYLLMLGCDGPNVNKKVERLVNLELNKLRLSGLISIGTCNLHVINNAFLKGLDEFGQNVANLIVAIKYFFKDRPSRYSDYQKCQTKMNVPKHEFINHVPSRWLTLQPAADRLLEQMPAVLEYFLNFLPRECKATVKTKTYNTIKEYLTDKTLPAQIMFISSSASLFTKFVAMFQENSPLIHLIYDEIKSLFLNLMVRFCKPDIINNVRNNMYDSNTFDINNLIPLENYKAILGLTISDKLNSCKVQEPEKLLFANKARKHYIAACQYIAKNIPIFNDDHFLNIVRCINPKLIERSDSSSIIKLAKKIPNISDNLNFLDLENEWKLLQVEVNDFSNSFEKRIDHFWRDIFVLKVNSGIKYPNLQKVIRALLCLSHGNAEVERGFSQSMRILTKDRNSLEEKTFNSILTVSDAIKNVYAGEVHKIEITPELCKLHQHARAAYDSYLTEKKRGEKTG